MNTMDQETRPDTPRAPDIWTYRDPRRYLNDLCDYLRAIDSSFSYRKLGRWAGLKSPNYIPTYLQGKRNLRPDTAQRIAAALELSEHEQRFFVMLTRFEQTDSETESADYYRSLLDLAVRYGQTGRIDTARLDYFSCWFIPVVHAMASLREFRGDPHWIAARINPKIRSFDAQKALDTLSELGIFQRGPDGSYTVAERRLETEPELQSLMIREYHRAMIRLSEASLDAWDPEKRIASAITLTVPSELIPQVLQRIESYREDMFSWLVSEQRESDAIQGDVMQINFQAFPVTELDES